ncbi:Calcipressin-domain-containing protein [Pseudoneurospora amorphoporcata]|uniref:Calcipressin-domain-containing protein n=1 Tax=Pseudoneurospora amorphoporcata TaxID=241081 RepID=A0AAN6SIX0_9PEZI|nr:Calcipressin-domain-containing protein [Pseudoneurospora amorphoporcata]
MEPQQQQQVTNEQSLQQFPDLCPASLSRPSTGRSSRKGSSLSLDLSCLPPLSQPTPPSNTLIFTNINSLDVFSADNLQTIRDLISQTAPIFAWSPLKSFRRIIVTFFDEQAAIAVRSVWDGEAILGERCRVYFGQPTPIDVSDADKHLALPDAGKLFFISPPPSPPHDWEQRMEDAPNTMVHAEDLAEALAKLRHHNNPNGMDADVKVPVSPASDGGRPGDFKENARKNRSRSSTLIFQPDKNHVQTGKGKTGGLAVDLPCVTVDDMTDEAEGDADGDIDMSPVSDSPGRTRPIFAHTARPPVELMHDA